MALVLHFYQTCSTFVFAHHNNKARVIKLVCKDFEVCITQN